MAVGLASGLTKVRPLRGGDVQFYRICEDLTELLIYPTVLFSSWAFASSETWSIQIMNGAGYALGALLAVKLYVRWFKGYRPARWGEPEPAGRGNPLVTTLAVLTVAILLYCFISALNARSTYFPYDQRFDPRQHLAWLPHSFDSSRSWFAFWSYLGLACSFWAVRDWLLGKTDGEERAKRQSPKTEGRPGKAGNPKSEIRNPKQIPIEASGENEETKDGSQSFARAAETGRRQSPGGDQLLPGRLRRLLWVLAINGALLGLEGIVQRFEGSGKLLFLVKPRVNPDAVTQFGSFAYRANASQFFNLLWPMCLGFWWTLHRARGFRRKTHHWLLLCGIIMAACPIISTSRGGALITIGLVMCSAIFLLLTHFVLVANRQEDPRTRRLTVAVIILFFVSALAVGYWLGWEPLRPRLARINEGFEGRERMYQLARPMAEDYPVFGTGPGTFEYVFQLYRLSTETYWPAQLHNDWLETRITFGWVGSALIALAFVMVFLRWFTRGGIHGGRRFITLIWLALAGCLVHARFDFPFQMHSIVFLFLLICAIASALARRP